MIFGGLCTEKKHLYNARYNYIYLKQVCFEVWVNYSSLPKPLLSQMQVESKINEFALVVMVLVTTFRALS